MRCTTAHAAMTAVMILVALVEASGASAVRLQNPISPPPCLYSAQRPKHWRVGEADGIDLVSSPPPGVRQCRVCCKSSVHDADNPSFFFPPSHLSLSSGLHLHSHHLWLTKLSSTPRQMHGNLEGKESSGEPSSMDGMHGEHQGGHGQGGRSLMSSEEKDKVRTMWRRRWIGHGSDFC